MLVSRWIYTDFLYFTYFTLRGKDGGSCHFHRTVLEAPCDASVCLSLFLLLNVVYLPIHAKLWLIVVMTKQTSDGKEVDVLNC